MPRTSPINDKIRTCLLSGMTYEETRNVVGVGPQKVARIALRLIDKGYVIKKYSDDKEADRVRRMMPLGGMGQVLSELNLEQLTTLSKYSFDNWADAVVNMIKDQSS